MIVSRNSWHYRLLRFWTNFYEDGLEFSLPRRWREELVLDPGPDPKSLCSYFWSIVFLTVFSLVFAAAVLPAVFVFAHLILVGRLIGERFEGRGRIRRSRKRRTPKLAVEYIKARKQRVCPLIELVD